MAAGKRIIHVDLPIFGQRASENRVVCFLAGVEAEILGQSDLARRQRCSQLTCARPDAITGKAHLLLQRGADYVGAAQPASNLRCPVLLAARNVTAP